MPLPASPWIALLTSTATYVGCAQSFNARQRAVNDWQAGYAPWAQAGDLCLISDIDEVPRRASHSGGPEPNVGEDPRSWQNWLSCHFQRNVGGCECYRARTTVYYSPFLFRIFHD